MSETSPEPTSQSWDSSLYQDKHSFVWESVSSLVDLLAPQVGERILDLGCGTGQLTERIACAGSNVVGLDNSMSMIEEARRQYPQIQFDIGDAHDFAYSEPFDAVFSNAALHWVTQPAKVVHCIHEVLKPNGRFVAEFGGRGNVQHVVEGLESASSECLGKSIPHPWYFPSVGEFASLLESVGLEVNQAALFDRPTPLEGEDGLRNWVQMFGKHWMDRIPDDRRESFFEHLEQKCRSKLYRDGNWHIDYRRLRVVAVRNPN